MKKVLTFILTLIFSLSHFVFIVNAQDFEVSIPTIPVPVRIESDISEMTNFAVKRFNLIQNNILSLLEKLRFHNIFKL